MISIGVGGSVDVRMIQRMIHHDEVLVGYPDGVAHPGAKIQNAELARALHFGTRRIPARPWLYQAIAAAASQLEVKIRRMLAREVYVGRRENDGEFSLNGIGAFLVGEIQAFVRSGFYKAAVPNAPKTVAKKGSDTPLIDTGFLINSTTYVTRTHLPPVRERTVRP